MKIDVKIGELDKMAYDLYVDATMRANKILCKKNKLIYVKVDLITVLKKGEYYDITYPVERLVCVRYGPGKHDIMLFNDGYYGYESIWEYFYTVKESRRMKLKRLLLI